MSLVCGMLLRMFDGVTDGVRMLSLVMLLYILFAFTVVLLLCIMLLGVLSCVVSLSMVLLSLPFVVLEPTYIFSQ